MGGAAEFRGTSRFRVIRRLGQGGMGVVHLVHDRLRGADVALKSLSRVEPAGLYRFKREFRAVSGIVHPNLVALHELIAEDDAWFLTMEYIDGVDFLVHLLGPGYEAGAAETTEPLPSGVHPAVTALSMEFDPSSPGGAPYRSEDQLREAFTQLATGIRALHAAGRVHKDIKPSNVVVDRGGRVVLLDFGMVDERPIEGERPQLRAKVFGTPAYMSPEQASGTQITEASDWYSFGVVLFEALTGRLPFDGTVFDIVNAKVARAAPAPSVMIGGLPADLEALCIELLRTHPRRRPDGSDVLQRLGGGGSHRPPVPSLPPRRSEQLVGRDDAVASLRAGLEDAVDEHAVAMLVQGPSGIGKSAVVRHFADSLVAADAAVVLRARCYERESVPFKAIDGIVDAISQYLGQLPMEEAAVLLPRNVPALAKLFPVLGQMDIVAKARSRFGAVPDPAEVRRRGFAALKELLGKISDRVPLVVWLDDVQWSDADSAALLVDLLRPPDRGAMLLICCLRSEARQYNPVVKALAGADYDLDLRHLDVTPLDDGVGRELAVSLLRQRGLDSSIPQLEAIVAEADGNPLFVGELVRAVRDSARPGNDGAGPSDRAPISLDRALHRRFDELLPRPRRLLEVLAVAGGPIDQRVLVRAMQSDGYVGFDLDVLQAKHLARTLSMPAGDTVECQHDRVGKALRATLGDEVVRSHALRLARAMEHVIPQDAETIASLYERAAEPARAAAQALRAAEHAAASLAFERAVGFYERALDSGTELARPRHQVLRELGDALANAGQTPAAARRYVEACAAAPQSGRLELERLAAAQFLRSGHVEEGTQALRSVLSQLGLGIPATPLRAVGSLLMRRGRLGMRGLEFEERAEADIAPELLERIDTCFAAASGLGLIDFVRGNDFQTRHLLLALEAGEPYRVARALCFEAGFVAAGGLPARTETEDLLCMAAELNERVDRPHIAGLVELGRGMAAWQVGEWRRSIALLRDSEAIFRADCTDIRWEVATGHIFDAAARYYLGDLVSMRKLSAERLREAVAVGDLYAASDLQTGVQVLPSLAADDPASVRAVIAEERKRWPGQGFNLQHWNQLLADSLADLYDGEEAAAWQRISSQWQPLIRSLVFTVQVVRIEGHQLRANCALALAAAGGGSRRELLRTADQAARRIARERAPWAEPMAQLIGAAVSHLRGDQAAATRGLQLAADGFDAGDMALFAACARLRLAQFGGGDPSQLERARAYLDSQGVRHHGRFVNVLAPGFS